MIRAALIALTLAASGPISINDIADEFQISRSSTFPTAFYGLGGAPASGSLSLADFYGRSRFTLSTDKTAITARGYSDSDTATITSTVSTSFTFKLLYGSPNGRVTLGPTSGSSTTIRLATPSNGCSSVSGAYRVTASNGDSVDITFSADWGTC